jgi:hypothetical protein
MELTVSIALKLAYMGLMNFVGFEYSLSFNFLSFA